MRVLGGAAVSYERGTPVAANVRRWRALTEESNASFHTNATASLVTHLAPQIGRYKDILPTDLQTRFSAKKKLEASALPRQSEGATGRLFLKRSPEVISQKVSTHSFFKGPFSHESVNWSFIYTDKKSKLTDLCGS